MQMGSEMESRVERVVSQSSQVDDFQRQSVMDLLQGKQTAQSSGEITGMLKAMLEEMEVRRSEPREAIGLDNSDLTLVQERDSEYGGYLVHSNGVAMRSSRGVRVFA